MRLVVTAADGTQLSQNLEFPRSPQAAPAGGDSTEERSYRLTGFDRASGPTEVAFIFLPGSDFDFVGFKFD